MIRGALLLAALASVPAAAQTAPVAEARIDTARAGAWIPLEVTNEGLLLIGATLDGKPVKALLSTTAPFTAVDEGWREAQGMTVREAALPERPERKYRVARIVSFAIGGYAQTGGEIGAMPLVAPLGKNLAAPFQMVVGTDFLANWLIQFDFDRSRIRFLPHKGADLLHPAVQLRPLPGGRAYRFAIAIDGHRIGPVVLDTSKDLGLTITADAWDGFAHPGVRMTDIMSVGTEGVSVRPYARIDGVELGGMVADDVDVAIAPTASAENATRAWIGTSLLRRYNIQMDMSAGMLRFGRRIKPEALRPKGTAGLQGPLTDNGILVRHLMRGSPAELGGIKPGETVCTINGEQVRAAWRGTPKADWGRRPAGTRVRLGMCNGREIVLTLAEFY